MDQASLAGTRKVEGKTLQWWRNLFEQRHSTIAGVRHRRCGGTVECLHQIPAHLDWFEWCTWDVSYIEVNPQGINKGLQSFVERGCSSKFHIIDDGWKEIVNEFKIEGETLIEETYSKTSAVARASKDFMQQEPTFQSLHIASMFFNNLLLREIVVPDWDMFQERQTILFEDQKKLAAHQAQNQSIMARYDDELAKNEMQELGKMQEESSMRLV